nr:MAG TPA: Terminase large subunit [Bacteriophage sp.]
MYRGSVVFDESGFLSEEMMNVYGAFAAVNRSMKTGKDESGKSIDPIRQRCFPQDMPYQKIYISSASSTDTKFFALYRDFAKKQIMGDPDFCVLHIDCELAFKPTLHGELIAPLLSRSTVQSEMRTNPEKARREYYCQFTTSAGANAIIKRGVITRNEEIRKPLLYNDTGDKRFVICYDPARSRDNSVILVGEIYDYIMPDESIDKRMRLVNCINLVDVGKKTKSPMQTPDQVEYLKQVILDYNGGADAYGNIVGVFIDAGSGGSGVNIADYLMPDWTDKAGITHRGLIDKEYSADYVKKFPNAVDKVHLISPTAYKSEMYEALIELMNQDKISFTAPYDGKGNLTVFDVDEKKLNSEKEKITNRLKRLKLSKEEFDRQLDEELNHVQSVKTKVIKLDWQDELALVNIDALKEELVNMVRKKRESGKDSFELTPEKANKMHDDRAYTAALAAKALMDERRKSIMNRKRKPSNNLADLLPIRTPKRKSYI